MLVKKQDIVNAYRRIREIDSTIPDHVLDFMKEAAYKAVEELEVHDVVLGKRRMYIDTPIRVGHAVFTMFGGAVIKIDQLDPAGKKAVVDFGDGFMDWKTYRWIAEHSYDEDQLVGEPTVWKI